MHLEQLPNHLKPFFDQLSSVVGYAEKSWIYSTSQFISKVGAYDAILDYQKGKRATFQLKVYQIVKYSTKSFFYFWLFLLLKIIHIASRQKSPRVKTGNVYIDSYLVVDFVLEGNDIVQNYFPGLTNVLKKIDRNYIVIPRFYGTSNPFSYFKLFQKFKKESNQILTEFELFGVKEFVKLGFFLILYPFQILRFYRECILPLENNDFLKYYFWIDMNGSNFFGGVRYLFGKKLSKILKPSDKVIQWFENQPYEKSLNRAIRESNLLSTIYGCQLFLFPPEVLNGFVDPNEISVHVPDQILVNGMYYKDKFSSIQKLGPSIRYQNLFKTPIYQNKEKESLVLFSYFKTANKEIIKLLNIISRNTQVNLKLHPTNSISDYRDIIEFDYNLRSGDIYRLFENTEIVMGAASGTLVDAVACGIPVIVVTQNEQVDYSYLPNFAKGILWDIAYDSSSFQNSKDRLLRRVKNSSKERLEMIHRVRNEMFYEPTEERILEAFELV